MSETKTIEQRLTRMERELKEIKERLETEPKDNWISRMRGHFKDDPVFDEIVRLGKDIRDAELPPDEDTEEQS